MQWSIQKSSGIKEFDDCLSAIDDMRDALRESLEKQWKTEQEKKQQMSALAHDIKNTSYDCTGKCRTTFRD